MEVFNDHERGSIIQLDGGEELVDAITRFSGEREIAAGWVRGGGQLSSARIEPPGAPARRIVGPLALVSLDGSIALEAGGPRPALRAILATADGSLVGGTLLEAEAMSVELWLSSFEGIRVERARGKSGLPALKAPAPTDEDRLFEGRTELSRPAPSRVEELARRAASRPRREPSSERAAEGGPSWADVAAASTQRPEIEGPERTDSPSWADVAALSDESQERTSWADVAAASARDEEAPGHRVTDRQPPPRPSRRSERPTSPLGVETDEEPRRGDLLDHKQFGLCEVERVSGEGALTIRLARGTRKTIKLTTMAVTITEHRSGKRLFVVRPRPR